MVTTLMLPTKLPTLGGILEMLSHKNYIVKDAYFLDFQDLNLKWWSSDELTSQYKYCNTAYFVYISFEVQSSFGTS